jgi:hypothetical protein
MDFDFFLNKFVIAIVYSSIYVYKFLLSSNKQNCKYHDVIELRRGNIFMRESPASASLACCLSVRQQAGGDAQTEPSCTG